MFKTTAIDTLKQDKKCQACWYMILSTMSGSTTDNGKISDVFVIIGLKSMLSCLVGARLILLYI